MGPLHQTRIIEMKGIGPAPYAGMLLADLGAEVIVVERSTQPSGIGLPAAQDVHSRGKKSIALDIKKPGGLDALLRLVDSAQGFIEGFRPGVAERVGFGPDVCLARNPALIYGRLTGWGQTGPLANVAGHDINYISLTGALAAIGGADKPVLPLNLLGDYGGGSLFLVIGMLAAMLESQKSGKGQVIDAAITDGSASLMSVFYGWSQLGQWSTQRHANLLDGAAHHYDVYETKDGKFVSIGALEPQFHALLLEKLDLDPEDFTDPQDPTRWPLLKTRIAATIKSRTRREWRDRLEGSDVCFAPVVDYTQAPEHPHNKARGTYIDIEGHTQPGPTPRFSRTPCDQPTAPRQEGADTQAILEGVGFSAAQIAELRDCGALP